MFSKVNESTRESNYGKPVEGKEIIRRILQAKIAFWEACDQFELFHKVEVIDFNHAIDDFAAIFYDDFYADDLNFEELIAELLRDENVERVD